MSVSPVRPQPSVFILVAMSALGPIALNIFLPSMPGLARELSVDYGTVQLTLTFFLVGLGVVIGAELNAALAEVPRDSLENAAQGEMPEA